jgi:hypothetical protein
LSTKIYNAYVWKSGDIHSLIRRLHKIKEACFEYYLPKIDFEFTVEKITGYWDQQEKIKEAMRKGHYDPLNISCSAIVYFYTDKAEGDKIIVQFFGLPWGDESFSKRVRLTGFKDFHYQNSTDILEKGITEQEWKYRKKVWDNIFKKSHLPCEAGLTFDFIQEPQIIDIVSLLFERKNGRKPFAPVPTLKKEPSAK